MHRLLILLFIMSNTILVSGQIQEVMPILTTPNKLIDQNGNVVAELPPNYSIINSLDGNHDMGWVQGMADIDIGECGNILAIDYDTREIAMFDLKGNKLRSFSNRYSTITPCQEGYHVGHFLDPNDTYKINKRFHFLDLQGYITFEPGGYSMAKPFNDGLAAVSIPKKGWTYINDLGHEKDIIPEQIKNIKDVSSFYHGLSMIKSYRERDGYLYFYDGYYIDRKGEIVLDIQKLFPDKQLSRMSSFRGGTALLEFKKPKGDDKYRKSEYYYINTEGKVISSASELDGFREAKSAFIGYNETQSNKSWKVHLNDAKGEKLSIPRIDGLTPTSVYPINDHYFQLTYSGKKGKGGKFVYDASVQDTIQKITGDVMAIKGDLISFKNSMTKRHFVINYKTKEIVLDTDVSNLKVRNLDHMEGEYSKVKNFVCSRMEDVDRLPLLTNLKELTIQNLEVESLPDLSSLTKLKILRIDNCRSLKQFPDYLTKLTQLSLRSCTSATNTKAMIDNQTELEILYLLNFDLPSDYKRLLSSKYPKGEIFGNAKSAESELQVISSGF